MFAKKIYQNCFKCRKFSPLVIRLSHHSVINAEANSLSQNDNTKLSWEKAVREAEKIVGYPPSFANLRWLLSDEISNVAMHLRKLVGSNHPILKTAKHLLYNDKNNTQAWGLIILLLSKAAGLPEKSNDHFLNSEIFQRQRIMAEIIEIIRTGHVIHKSLLNVAVQENPNNKENLNFGNKIALLTGDYLLVTANGMLAKLKNQHLSELVSSSLRDLTDAEYIGERDPQNLPIPSKHDCKIDILDLSTDPKIKELVGYDRKFEPLDPADCVGNPTREWTLRNTLEGGSLLGVGFQGVLHLAGHNNDLEKAGFVLGCHVALAWQAIADYNTFILPNSDHNYSLVCAPVLFALNEDPDIYDRVSCSKDGAHKVKFEELSAAIRKTSALEQTLNMFHEHCTKVKSILKMFPSSKATDVLENMICTINIR